LPTDYILFTYFSGYQKSLSAFGGCLLFRVDVDPRVARVQHNLLAVGITENSRGGSAIYLSPFHMI
jgi:hypothetical protein